MEEIVFKYIIQAGALGVLVYVVYSDRLDRKSMMELFTTLSEKLDILITKKD